MKNNIILRNIIKNFMVHYFIPIFQEAFLYFIDLTIFFLIVCFQKLIMGRGQR